MFLHERVTFNFLIRRTRSNDIFGCDFDAMTGDGDEGLTWRKAGSPCGSGIIIMVSRSASNNHHVSIENMPLWRETCINVENNLRYVSCFWY